MQTKFGINIYIYIIHNSWGDWSLGKTFYGLSFHLSCFTCLDGFIYLFWKMTCFWEFGWDLRMSEKKILLFNLQ